MCIQLHNVKRCLSLLLCFSLLLSAVPMPVMAEQATCGIQAHSHTDSCFETKKTQVCELSDTIPHTHVESCFAEDQTLNCDLSTEVPHAHTDSCYESEKIQICTLTEHEHNEDCYAKQEDLEAAGDSGDPSKESESQLLPLTTVDKEPPKETESQLLKMTIADTEDEEKTILKATDSTGNIDLSVYSKDLWIYNYMCASNSDGGGLVFNSEKFTIQNPEVNGERNAQNITIGGDTEKTGDARPLERNIPVALKGLELPEGKTMTILPVNPDSSMDLQVEMTVEEASSVHTMVLEKDAVLEITLAADLTIENLYLADGSVLKVNLEGHNLTVNGTVAGRETDETMGYGELVLSGSGNVSAPAITCQNLTVEAEAQVTLSGDIRAKTVDIITSAQVYAGGKNIVAEEAVSVIDSTVENAALLGFDDSVTGTVNLTIRNSTIKNETGTTRVGAADTCTALVCFNADASSTSSGDIHYVRDYTITYQNVTEQPDWIKSYRVTSASLAAGSDAQILTANKALPQYQQDGYEFQGWICNGAEEPIFELTNQQADLTLEPKLLAKDMTVVLNLGFEPEGSNCDMGAWAEGYTEGVKTVVQKLGTAVTLDAPDRFGYVFEGWEIKGTTHKNSYTIALQDVEEGTVTLTAKWRTDTFPLDWTLLGVAKDNIRICVDYTDEPNSGEWLTVEAFAAKYSNYWMLENQTLKSLEPGWIAYGETLGEYFERLGLRYPRLKDARTDENVQAFAGWFLVNMSVSEETEYEVGASNSLLAGKVDSQTWAQYQAALKSTPLALNSSFGTASYELHITPQDGWTYYINDVVVTPVDGVLTVLNGAKVTLSIDKDSALSISDWFFASLGNVEVSERAYDGGTILYYDFTMPASNVDATYGGTGKYINIARGSVEFESDYAYNGFVRSGFWHPHKLNGGTSDTGKELLGRTPLLKDPEKGYFYLWNNSKEFYVTSDNQATTNQLILDTSIKVVFEDVNLDLLAEYQAQMVGRTVRGKPVVFPRNSDAISNAWSATATHINKDGMKDLGNIVITQSGATAQSYTLKFLGKNNRVGSICHDKFYGSDNLSLTIEGEGKTVTDLSLGTVFTNCGITVQNMTLKEISEANSAYILYTVAPEKGIGVYSAQVEAKNKEIFNRNINFSLGANCSADVKTITAGRGMGVASGANLRIRGDLYTGMYSMTLGSNCRIVIDGSYLSNGAPSDGGTMGASGAIMIVKGNRCALNDAYWTAGTLICNTLVMGVSRGITGGTIVANQIINAPTSGWDVKRNTTDYVFSTYSGTRSNGDAYPFYTGTSDSDSHATFSFQNCKIYLLGYYETKATSKGYSFSTDFTMKTTPVWALVQPMLDADGGLISGKTLDTAAAETAVKTGAYKNNECVIMGNSIYKSATCSRTVSISKNAEIYAAGNLTFFNEVKVSGTPTIWCGGTFGTKGNMDITGGNITAREVGIAYNLTETLDDDTIRWKLLTVAGGNIDADRVGTLSTCVSDSAHEIRGTALIDPACLEDTNLVFDTYVNYQLGNLGYTNPEANSNNVHILGTVQNGAATYRLEEAVAFAAPASGETEGQWSFGSVSGEIVDGINTDAKMTREETVLEETAYGIERMALYVTQNSFKVTVKAGSEYITALDNVEDSTATAESTVTLTLSSEDIAANKTVVWYIDSEGNYRNPGLTVNGSQVSFEMPYYDVEIYVAPVGMELDLSMHHVTITKDGFRTCIGDEVEDREFHYTGDLTIKQSLTEATPYQIRVLADVDNYSEGTADSRRFTLRNLNQKKVAGVIGLRLENGAKTKFYVDGTVSLFQARIWDRSVFHVEGITADRKNKIKFEMWNTDSFAIGTGGGSKEKIGSITFKNLTLPENYGNRFDSMCHSEAKNADATIRYINCAVTVRSWHSGSHMAQNVGRVVIEHCDITATTSSSYSAPIFSGVDNVEIVDNSTIKVTGLGGTSATSSGILHSVSNSVVVESSTVTQTLWENTGARVWCAATGPATLTLKGNTVYNAEARLTIKSLILEDNSTFTVGKTGSGYLFANNIEVHDNAALTANTILVSGFNTKSGLKNKSQVLDNLSAPSPSVRDGSSYDGLSISGGTVSAVNVGGDVNSKIKVEGGTLTAQKIGTLGKLYGYSEYYDSSLVYTYEKVPVGATIEISGGTVTVANRDTNLAEAGDYLGGMNSVVTISGGQVNLPENAVLGMTEEHQKILEDHCTANGLLIDNQTNSDVSITGGKVEGEGAIYAPYSDVAISNPANVELDSIEAYDGTIAITNVTGGYTNSEYNASYGVHVRNNLSAREIDITDGSVVYARSAIANAPNAGDTGHLKVELDSAKLYTETFGSAGNGNVTIEGRVGQEIITKDRQFFITYNLRDDAIDRADNHPDNPTTYIAVPPDDPSVVELQDPTRHGFEFMGWYASAEAAADYKNYEEDRLSSIKRSYGQDVYLFAAWKPIDVVFRIFIDQESVDGLNANLKSEYDDMDQSAVTYDAATDKITFVKTVSIPYRDPIFGTGEENRINLSDYVTPSYGFATMKMAEKDMEIALDPTNATVTKEILDHYLAKIDVGEENPEFVLKAFAGSTRNMQVILDLNRTNLRPKNAVFPENAASKEGDTIYVYVNVGSKLSTVQALAKDTDSGLIEPSAPGYTFKGWTKADGEQTVTSAYVVNAEEKPHFYAKWEPKTYQLQFDAGSGNLMTKTGDKPETGAPQTMTATVTYDTALQNGLSYNGEGEKFSLPSAWEKGKVFLGWAICDENGNPTDILLKETKANGGLVELNLTDIPQMREKDKDALKLAAVYAPLNIVYHIYDTQMTAAQIDKYNLTTDGEGWLLREKETAYTDPLWGYKEFSPEQDPADYKVLATGTNEDDKHFAAVSTTAAYYNAEKKYVEQDYRNEDGPMHKGYTFSGWMDAETGGEAVNTVPRYPESATLDLWGSWTPNTYQLVLHNADEGMVNSGYNTYHSATPTSPATVNGVAVDREITKSLGTEWPSRNGDWYAQTTDSSANEDKRYLMGFTFDAWEPGNTTNGRDKYEHYAGFIVPNLINQDVIFYTKEANTAGAVFHLPENWEYDENSFATGAKNVPDYPDGATIPLYGVYRERSLVFVDYYIDGDGNQVETVLKAAPYSSYSDFPATYTVPADHPTVALGYKLQGWKVLIPNGSEYPDPENGEKNWRDYLYGAQGWIQRAQDLGTFDIYVYTNFVAQVEVDLELKSDGSMPTKNTGVTAEYTIPKSMKPDTIQYVLEGPDNLELVSKEKLDENRYDPAHVNYVAIKVELVNTSGETVGDPYWLGVSNNMPTAEISPGWKIRFTMYYSAVIPSDMSDKFTLTVNFKNYLDQQFAKLNVDVENASSKWSVDYTAELPAEEPHLKIMDTKGFNRIGQNSFMNQTVNGWTYQSALMAENSIPVLEGYEPMGTWVYSAAESFAYGADGTMKLSQDNNDRIALFTEYKKLTYTLDNQAKDKCTVTADMVSGKVPYHNVVTLTTAENPAFIWLAYTDADGKQQNVRLDEQLGKDYPFYAEEQEGSYTFLMPASDVTITYDKELDLYLDNGTISITPEGYKQVGLVNQEATWPGNYRIWQDENDNIDFHSTEYVLNLAGDLSDRSITLGRLNIESDDSVALSDGAKVNLLTTGDTSMKNILVPENAELNLSGGQKMELKPVVGKAAIGGSGANGGAIAVKDMTLNVTMPGGSDASIIGPGNAAASAGTVSVTGGSLDVAVEANMTLGGYRGTWLGSASTETVNVKDVIMSTDVNGGTITDGKKVTLTNCKIGTPETLISGHALKGDVIAVDRSEIYLTGSSNLLGARTSMTVDENAENTYSKILITGSMDTLCKLYLADPHADVVIAENRLLELKHGDITISEEGSNQKGAKLDHDGAYRLLSNYEAYKRASVTVAAGLTETKRITAEETCALNKLQVNSDTVLIPLDELPVTEVAINENATLHVDAQKKANEVADKGLIPQVFGGDGNYSQTGGKLTANTDLVVGGNMTLDDVTASAPGKNVGSNGASGVTTVTLKNTNVTADRVGAIGEQNDTFTFVVMENSSVSGTLVQDHYRLHYNLEDDNFKTNTDGVPYKTSNKNILLETVLRSETDTEGAVTYLPVIPENPSFKPAGDSYFSCWFINSEEKIALSTESSVVGFSRVENSLTTSMIDYAAEEAEDGTRTLELYAFMKIKGEGFIQAGRHLNEMTQTKREVTIAADGAWTARFDVTGTVAEGADYEFTFQEPLPAGTRLTLAFRDEKAAPVFSYYVASGGETLVKAQSFKQMGQEQSPSFFDEADRTGLFQHSLQLSADFSATTAVAGNVGVRVTHGQQSQVLDAVSYQVEAVGEASISLSSNNVTVTVPNDTRLQNKKLYLTATFNTEVPYDTVMELADLEAEWIDRDTACFELGDYEDLDQETYAWTIDGLEDVTYNIQWKLTAAEEENNPFGTETEPARNLTDEKHEAVYLAEKTSEDYQAPAKAEPKLKVQLVNKDVVFAEGNPTEVMFSITTNAETVTAVVEKQGNWIRLYKEISTDISCSTTDATVTIPGEKGLYRVRFSINGETSWDDVYYSFIVE